MRRPFTLALLAAAVLAFGLQEKAYDLLFKPKKDATQAYTMTIELTSEGEKFEIESEMRVKVLSVAENGDYEIERTIEKSRMKFDGEETDMGAEEPEIEKYDAKGNRIKGTKKEEDEGSDPLTHAFDLLTECTPEKPMKVGETWSREVKEDKEFDLFAAKAEYKILEVVKVADVECLKISAKFTQTGGSKPAKGEGTLWIEIADFSPVKVEGTIEDLKIDEEDGTAASVKVKLARR
jgi:hypothetical protein